jgi:xylan 1,4-beta-xylosidase
MATTFSCDFTGPASSLPHFWEHTIGSDHAPMALRADWQEQMRRAHEELGFAHVRFHGLLCDDVGTLVAEGDTLFYSFFNADQIFDFLLSIGMRPFVELSFMPGTLASGDKTVFHYRANVTPPRDYAHWATLIRKLIAHWVERYGLAEVREWFFEVWNEPNLRVFGSGRQRDYFKLYRYTAEAIKSVDSALKVGGPATAANAWIGDFIGFCARSQLPADFITTHHYPNDTFGRPGDDTEAQLSKSRRSALRDQTREVRRQAGDRPVYYTEWGTSSNPRDPMHDEPYAAAFITKTIMEANGSRRTSLDQPRRASWKETAPTNEIELLIYGLRDVLHKIHAMNLVSRSHLDILVDSSCDLPTAVLRFCILNDRDQWEGPE